MVKELCNHAREEPRRSREMKIRITEHILAQELDRRGHFGGGSKDEAEKSVRRPAQKIAVAGRGFRLSWIQKKKK